MSPNKFFQLLIWLIIIYSNTNFKDINDCKLDPCIHGNCTDRVNSYICLCNPGYSGKMCAEGTKKLKSLTWFTINCSSTKIKDINDCEPDPCKHGHCIDGVNSYTCICNAGFTGTNCAECTNKFH